MPIKKNSIVKVIVLCSWLLLNPLLYAQSFAPHATQIGSSAVHKDSLVFVDWANNCSVNRGYVNIADKSLGFANSGNEAMACGKADIANVLSLGDGGSAICTFSKPIKNGTGFDFAVFENSFDHTFLELAFVEVSSDGVHFFRFASRSLSDTVHQTNSFGSTQAIHLDNLAGKYKGGYGTPFDLEELNGINGLDINAITHVKIIDVVGSLQNDFVTRDSKGNKINDPWPTPFPSSGFDLDAIGVIHQNKMVDTEELENFKNQVHFFPNPCQVNSFLQVKSNLSIKHIQLLDLQGKVIIESEQNGLNVKDISPDVYFIKIRTEIGIVTKPLVVLPQ
jgi:hypothetical protein